MGNKISESRELFKTAHLLLDSGVSINNVAQTLSLSPKTIRAYKNSKSYNDYAERNRRYQNTWKARKKMLELKKLRKSYSPPKETDTVSHGIDFDLPSETQAPAMGFVPTKESSFDSAEAVAELHIKITKNQDVLSKFSGSEANLLLAITFLITAKDEDVKELVDLATKLVAMSKGAVQNIIS